MRPDKRVLVTGGCGLIGSHLCERLLADGCEVICLDNFSTGTARNVRPLVDDPAFHLVEADVTAGIGLDGPLDAVLHLASPASPYDYLRLPLETMKAGSLGTLHALDLAAAKGATFLLTSTSEVYGDPLVHPQPESYWGNVNPVGPRAVYDEAKRFSEALAVAFQDAKQVATKIVRVFNTFGPRMRADDGRMIPTFICQAIDGRALTVTGDGSQTRSLCYVSDTVEGIVRTLWSDDEHGPVNIGGGLEMSVLDTARLILALTGSRSPIEFVDRPQDDPAVRRPDLTRAATSLGWRPVVDVETGLRRTVDWFLATRTVSTLAG
ncbi:NAD-dependent epimerase/dehydratase family protein [Actinokineospora fastidiosa]|uniref:Epimerase n=1 Tax=Actinokineospora fastidiosa TaxID=1816 RepID=A0A918LGB2_9PSEU|nr:NAD-dependent epimerase/dehydratase family protein [Actinokineospora fastidiosa]GGS45035.1 epimerase [Actinokineospora fastidiosa]